MERDRHSQGVKANNNFTLFTFWSVQLGAALPRYIVFPRYVVTTSMGIKIEFGAAERDRYP
jgi:hypothetical protein